MRETTNLFEPPGRMDDILCGVFHKVGLRDKTEIIPTERFM